MKKNWLIIFISSLLLIPIYTSANIFVNSNDWIDCGEVFGIKKDQKGFMWFLTNKGIKKYDGKEIINYSITFKNKPLSLFSNYNYLFCDSHKVLWVVGKNGLIFKYNNNKDKFDLVYDLSKITKSELINLSLVYFDNNDNIWLCDDNNRYIFDTKANKTIFFKSSIDGKTTSIVQMSKHRYLTTSDYSIYSFDFYNEKVTNVLKKTLDSRTHFLYTYYHKPSNNLILCTKLKGISLYNLKTKKISVISKTFTNVNVNAIQPSKDDKNKVFIATNGSGIYQLDLSRKEIFPIYNNYIENNYHISTNVIKDLFIDNDNRIWISIFPHGVLKFTNKNNNYSSYRHSTYNSNSLICDQVNDIIEDSDGDYCFATNNGISIYNKKNNRWINNLYSTFDNDFYNYAFKMICEIKKGEYLVGGYMFGAFTISKYDLLKKNINIKNISKKIISNNDQINTLYKENNNVWLGDKNSLIKYNIINKNIERYNIDKSIFKITNRDSSTLWLGAINGLYTFDKKTKKVTPIKLSPSIVSISSIYQGGRNLAYIGSYNNGLYIYNNKTKQVVNYTAENSSLNSNTINNILPASNNDLILNTDVGISYFEHEKELFINRNEEQGWSPGFFNPTTSVKTKNGKYLFGSNEGALEIDEDIFKEKKSSSRLFFYDFSILYKDMIPGDIKSPLKTNIDDSRLLKLNYLENVFSLKVSSIDYNNQSNILYSWILEGFVNQWTRPGKDNVIRYQNVPPGNYRLRVRSILMDNLHIIQEKDLNIRIVPPFWKSTSAYIFYIICLMYIGYIIFRFLWMRKQRNDNNDKINFFINTAHEIKTPLSLIKAPIEGIIKNEKLSDSGLVDAKIALKNTQLLTDLTTNLIDFEKEKYLSVLYVTRCKLKDFINLYIEIFKQYYKNDNIEIYVNDYTDNIEVLIDKKKIRSILMNIMSNSVKYCKDKCIINITLSNTNNHWQIEIKDNGVGFSKDDQEKLSKYIFKNDNTNNMRVTGSGIGLLYTYKLIKNHLGTITFSSTINVGTTFTFTFPLNDKRYNIIEESEKDSDESNIDIRKTTLKKKNIFDINNMIKAKYSIVIAEDNIDMCELLFNNLSGIYDIRIAYNGKEALELIRVKKPNLIISDFMMPIMDGKKLCEMIKGNTDTCHIPIIILTTLNDKEHIIKGLNIKADVFITKPFDMDIIKANISNLIENRQLINTAYSKINQNFVGDLFISGPELTADQEFIMKSVNAIRNNIQKDVNVEVLCGLLNMSRTSFYNKIRSITGYAPSDFIRNVKMDEACKLLKSKRYTVSEVAEMVGFNDPKYFTDIFKKYYNDTPSNYMKQN